MNALMKKMKESKIINEQNIIESKVVLVYNQMNKLSGTRMRVSLTALIFKVY